MLDFNRSPKLFSDPFLSFHAPVSLIPHIEARAYWDNQTVEVRLSAPEATCIEALRYKLRWELHSVVGVECVDVIGSGGDDVGYGVVRIPMGRVSRTELLPLKLTLLDYTGHELAYHFENLLVLPSNAAPARYEGTLAIVTSSQIEATTLSQFNYAVVSHLHSGVGVAISDSPDDVTLDWVRNGGKLLYVCEGDHARFWKWNGKGVSEGNWITSSSWLQPGAYPSLNVPNPLHLPIQRLLPRGSIHGFPTKDLVVQNDFLAGEVSGWVQRPRIHTVQFRYGAGQVVMTTYALLEALRSGQPDPFGVVMFNDLVDYLASDQCKPVLRVDV